MIDCDHDYDNPIRETKKGKYGAYTVYICPKCKEDISERYRYMLECEL